MAYLTLQHSHFKTLKDLTCFVAVADVLKSFGCVLAANIEEDFFSAAEA